MDDNLHLSKIRDESLDENSPWRRAIVKCCVAFVWQKQTHEAFLNASRIAQNVSDSAVASFAKSNNLERKSKSTPNIRQKRAN